MKLKIITIVDRGVPSRERLHVSVLADANLNFYAVFDTQYTDDTGEIVAIPKRAYWFTDYPVKAGDHVILYTKPGKDSVGERTDGHKNHFFHWGLRAPIWGSPEACAVLLEIADWETSLKP